jgi:hypothetical protein
MPYDIIYNLEGCAMVYHFWMVYTTFGLGWHIPFDQPVSKA